MSTIKFEASLPAIVTMASNEVELNEIKITMPATPNGFYNYYNPANNELVIDPKTAKRIVMINAISGGDQWPDYDAGSGGLTGFYLVPDSSTFALDHEYRSGMTYEQILEANNNGYSEGQFEFPIEWLTKNASGFFLLRGESGWERIDGYKYDLEGLTYHWGNGALMSHDGSVNKTYTLDGVRFVILSISQSGDYGTKVEMLVENTNKVSKKLKTTFGRQASYVTGAHGMFGAAYHANGYQSSDGSMQISDALSSEFPANTLVPTIRNIKNEGRVAYILAEGTNNSGTSPGLVFSLGYDTTITKCEILLDGNQTAFNYWISKGRLEGLKNVSGTYDGTYTVVNIPVTSKFRSIGIFANVVGYNNRKTLTGRVRLTFSDGTVLTQADSISAVSYMYASPMPTSKYAFTD